MYPLLRSLEADGPLAGEWEHPERRSRRFYRITDAGRERARRGWRASWPAARPHRRLDRRDPRGGALRGLVVLRRGHRGRRSRLPRSLPRLRPWVEAARPSRRRASRPTSASPRCPSCWARSHARSELVEATPPAGVPDWVQRCRHRAGGGFRDFAEASRSRILRAASSLGESLVTTYPVLRWDVGRRRPPRGALARRDGLRLRRRPCRSARRPRARSRAATSPTRLARWREAVAG